MPATILSDNGVTSGTSGIKTTGSNDGTLALQTTTAGGAATTALTINTTQAIGVGSSPSFGTNGQLLTSSGSGAAPTWTTVSAPAAATPTALGTVYGKTDTSANGYTFFGYQSGASTTGGGTTAVGYQALQTNSSGANSTAVGYQALNANTIGIQNTATGVQALLSNTTGNYNSAFGINALRGQTTGGDYNTACGASAGYSQTGDRATFVGYQAGYNSTGYGNTCFGYVAGSNITTGVANICIGPYSSVTTTTGNYQLTIGWNRVSKGADTGVIGGGDGGTSAMYQGNNSATWSVSSDRRLKKNIVDNTEGLSKIAQIKVRNFEYRLPEEVEEELKPSDAIPNTGVQLGVIAQELQEICPDCIKTESTGVMSVNSDNLFWHMVNAIKDLKALNDTQAATITALTARIVALENR
jgi:trimeric autotransporter adhesin